MSHMRQKIPNRNALIEAGFVVFARNASASLAEVAAEAGVGRATLHRHFAARKDLISALATRAEEELDAAVENALEGATSHADALQRIMVAIVPLANRQLFLSNDPDAYGPEIAEAQAKSDAELREAIDAAKREGSLSSEMHTVWIAQVFEGLVYAAWTAVDRQDLTPNQATDLAWRSFVNGVTGGAS